MGNCRVSPLHCVPPPCSFFPQLFLLETTSYGTEYPFGLLGSAVPSVFLRSFLPTPSLLTGGTEGGTEKPLMLGKCCSAIAETSVFYQDCFGHRCKTQHDVGGGEENSLHPSQNQGRVAQPAATMKATESRESSVTWEGLFYPTGFPSSLLKTA